MANKTISDFIKNLRAVIDASKSAQTPVSPTKDSPLASSALSNTRFDGTDDYSIANVALNAQPRQSNPNGDFEQTVDKTSVPKLIAPKGVNTNSYVGGNQEGPGTVSMSVNDPDTIEYTYKRGDTFGQVIKDLGLNTKKGLWGSDGDVAFYTKQLREQGIPGMVPIGTKIRLKRRK